MTSFKDDEKKEHKPSIAVRILTGIRAAVRSVNTFMVKVAMFGHIVFRMTILMLGAVCVAYGTYLLRHDLLQWFESF